MEHHDCEGLVTVSSADTMVMVTFTELTEALVTRSWPSTNTAVELTVNPFACHSAPVLKTASSLLLGKMSTPDQQTGGIG